MTSLPKFPKPIAQLEDSTQLPPAKGTEATQEPALKSAYGKPFAREPFPIWQITTPLGFVLIFAISCLTAYFMVEGRLIFDLSINPHEIRMKVGVDKTKGSLDRGENTTIPMENE